MSSRRTNGREISTTSQSNGDTGYRDLLSPATQKSLAEYEAKFSIRRSATGTQSPHDNQKRNNQCQQN